MCRLLEQVQRESVANWKSFLDSVKERGPARGAPGEERQSCGAKEGGEGGAGRGAGERRSVCWPRSAKDPPAAARRRSGCEPCIGCVARTAARGPGGSAGGPGAWPDGSAFPGGGVRGGALRGSFARDDDRPQEDSGVRARECDGSAGGGGGGLGAGAPEAKGSIQRRALSGGPALAGRADVSTARSGGVPLPRG